MLSSCSVVDFHLLSPQKAVRSEECSCEENRLKADVEVTRTRRSDQETALSLSLSGKADGGD
jgi:hypothetical protein